MIFYLNRFLSNPNLCQNLCLRQFNYIRKKSKNIWNIASFKITISFKMMGWLIHIEKQAVDWFISKNVSSPNKTSRNLPILENILNVKWNWTSRCRTKSLLTLIECIMNKIWSIKIKNEMWTKNDVWEITECTTYMQTFRSTILLIR